MIHGTHAATRVRRAPSARIAALCGTIAFCLLAAGCARDANEVVIGSKSFTEGVILGEALTLLARERGIPARHQAALGGTRLVFNALATGEIDAYIEYTGTLENEIFAGEALPDTAALEARLGERGIALAGSIGFESNYALGMSASRAAALGIETISDLHEHPGLRVRLSNEFMERDDGWPSLRQFYGLPQTDVLGVDHDIAYRALDADDADLTDLYTTDAEIEYYDLRTLDDDRDYFPRYAAVLLHRADLEARVPGALAALERLVGTVDEARMTALNASVKLGGRTEPEAARTLLADALGLTGAANESSLAGRLARRTAEHLLLVGASLLAAVLVAVPTGVFAARRPRLGQALIAAAGLGQTIPALALLVMLVPLLGIGAEPALVALFIYSLLPIVRNTHAGITGIAPGLMDAARALGLPARARLRRIELPLALPTILAGIKTAAVINVGGATLGALVGAGGYGQPILTGIRLDDTALILEGALPAAALALLVQWSFEQAERSLLPRGIRPR